ncbi:MAG: dipeptide ABC transporter ATP-binding protein [Desulfobacteraceae bacterium]|nr:dipeptide ABC transporter ATP-binding protein [Desulfobacteraceae bacterium]
MSPILTVGLLKKYFHLGRGIFSGTKATVRAVDGISFEVEKGKTLGLVGESGSGKTTVGRCILRLIKPTAGDVLFDKMNVTRLPSSEIKRLRRQMQIIFQDPYGCLTPRMKIRTILTEPLEVHGIGTRSEHPDRVAAILEKVGLRPEHMNRFPHEFSGGQRQRIAIARTLMVNPDLIIADEPVSALDVSIQAQIINLLVELQRELGLSYLLISHDLSVIHYMCDRIAVMYLGKIVEMSSRADLYTNPLHPYTEALLSAIPVPKTGPKRKKILLGGEVPSPISPPEGCSFHPRCNYKTEECTRVEPLLKGVGDDHWVSCHLR